MKKDDLYYNNTRYSFAKHIAPVLNDLEEENEENIYASPKTYGNLVYDMSFTSEGKDALESFYADTCGEMTDENIAWLETTCKEAEEDDEAGAEEVLNDIAGEIFEWVMGESSYIELDNESATDAGEYRRVYIYLNELLWKEAHGKDRLSQTAYDIIESATSDWKDVQDYC